jgi:hypothetical protein
MDSAPDLTQFLQHRSQAPTDVPQLGPDLLEMIRQQRVRGTQREPERNESLLRAVSRA